MQSDTHREVNYIFMRMQRLEKANGQKIAELLAKLLAVVALVTQMNRQLPQAALKLWVKFTPQEDKYTSSLEWFWIYVSVTKNTIWVLLF